MVLALAAEGLNNCEIARQTGIPRRTVRDWVRGGRLAGGLGRGDCQRCGGPFHDPPAVPARDYAYLLGLYLGDGTITRSRRDVLRLRIALDSRYPEIIAACARAMRGVLSSSKILVQRRLSENCVNVGVYSRQLACLIPQHGSGRKHERPIRLERWQETIAYTEVEALLRGLIHSDGCRHLNRVFVRGKRYVYPRYNFSNHSADIRGIFTAACDRLGIESSQMNATNVSVARRASVAQLDEFVGSKW